jgi:pimeloyl-ACP methyl ester carboxylesterase
MRRNNFAYVDVLMKRWAPSFTGTDRDSISAEVKRAYADPRVLNAALGYYHDATPAASPRLSQPALIVGGTTDIAPEVFRKAPKVFDAPCQVLICGGAGHWPHRESAALFHEHLLAFLAERSA